MARRRSEVEWPSLEPVRSTRIYEEIVRQIRLLIADGHLKSGDRLPPERDLAERFRVSRTSVREAMRALESRGLIGIRPGEGAFVREVSVETLVEPLALVILAQRETIADLYEARRLLEPAIAGLAARRASPEEIADMTRILDEQSAEVAAGRTGLAQDAAFHQALAPLHPQPRDHPDRDDPRGPPRPDSRGVPVPARPARALPRRPPARPRGGRGPRRSEGRAGHAGPHRGGRAPGRRARR